MSGYIKLHRSIVNWEWYDDVVTTRLFIHLLLKANFTDGHWRGRTVKRGQTITSLSKLAKEANLTIKQIRTALKKLKSTGEVASKGTSQFSLITLTNYDLYQSDDLLGASNRASNRASEGQAKGKRGASEGQQYKKEKKKKNDKKEEVVFFPDNLNNEVFKKSWKEWVAFRKEKKKALTPTTIAKQLNFLSNLGLDNAVVAIENSITNGWQGLFKPRKTTNNSDSSWIDDLQCFKSEV